MAARSRPITTPKRRVATNWKHAPKQQKAAPVPPWISWPRKEISTANWKPASKRPKIRLLPPWNRPPQSWSALPRASPLLDFLVAFPDGKPEVHFSWKCSILHADGHCLVRQVSDAQGP